jgi:hypothetical protein
MNTKCTTQENSQPAPVHSPKKESMDGLILTVLLLMLALIPLIIRVTIFHVVSPNISNTNLDTGLAGNVFTYYKQIWLIVGTLLITLMFLFKMTHHNYLVAKSYINLPVAVMLLLIILSSIFSDLRTISLFGYSSRNEGALTYVCYLILFYVAANLDYSPKSRKWLFYSLLPLIVINVSLGLVYFYGYNILNSDLVLSLILPSNMSKTVMQSGSYINSTLMNPDFASGIGGVLTAIFITKALFAKDTKSRVLNIIVATGSYTIILTSLAKSGFFTIVATLPILGLIILFSKVRKQRIITLSAALLVFTLILFLLSQHNPMVWDKSVGFFLGTKAGYETITNLSNSSNVQTPITTQENTVDQEFNLPPSKWAPGTGRLYIWPETLKLIEAHPILGYGRDTLPYVFNQNDPNKASGLADPNIIVDKPHNIFLDIAVGSGIPCLLVFLALCFCYIKDNIRSFKSRVVSQDSNILIILFVGWCAFLIQGMFNDTIIGTGIIFWILFGASVAIARQELPLEK